MKIYTSSAQNLLNNFPLPTPILTGALHFCISYYLYVNKSLQSSFSDSLVFHFNSIVSDDAHDRPSKKDLLIGKRKDKKDSKKDRGYATLEGESSPEEDPETKLV